MIVMKMLAVMGGVDNIFCEQKSCLTFSVMYGANGVSGGNVGIERQSIIFGFQIVTSLSI